MANENKEQAGLIKFDPNSINGNVNSMHTHRMVPTIPDSMSKTKA
jgi:hypothetical protein